MDRWFNSMYFKEAFQLDYTIVLVILTLLVSYYSYCYCWRWYWCCCCCCVAAAANVDVVMCYLVLFANIISYAHKRVLYRERKVNVV